MPVCSSGFPAGEYIQPPPARKTELRIYSFTGIPDHGVVNFLSGKCNPYCANQHSIIRINAISGFLIAVSTDYQAKT